MKFSKILQIIALPLMVILTSIVASKVAAFPTETVKNTIIILSISLLLAILALLYFAILFGYGGIEDWMKFMRELKSLKENSVQRALSELIKLPNIIEIINKQMIPSSMILSFSEYLTHLRGKNIEEIWVLGASLNPTLDNLEGFLKSFEKERGEKYQFLCVGDKNTIKFRGEKIVNYLRANNPEYPNNIKINWIEKHFVQLPMEILNPQKDNAEVIIKYPYEVKIATEEEHVFLITNKQAVRDCTEKFRKLLDSYSEPVL